MFLRFTTERYITGGPALRGRAPHTCAQWHAVTAQRQTPVCPTQAQILPRAVFIQETAFTSAPFVCSRWTLVRPKCQTEPASRTQEAVWSDVESWRKERFMFPSIGFFARCWENMILPLHSTLGVTPTAAVRNDTKNWTTKGFAFWQRGSVWPVAYTQLKPLFSAK